MVVMGLLAGCLWLCLRALDWVMPGPVSGGTCDGVQGLRAPVESGAETVEAYRGLEAIRLTRVDPGLPLPPDIDAALNVTEARLRLRIAVAEQDARQLGRAIAALDRAAIHRNAVDHPQHWAADHLLREDIAMVRALAGVDVAVVTTEADGPLASVP